MGVLDVFFERMPERASDHFGELKRLPPASFRGIDCRQLAEQYRRVRALEVARPDIAALLSPGVRSSFWTSPLSGPRQR